jgi:hypothetical protein
MKYDHKILNRQKISIDALKIFSVLWVTALLFHLSLPRIRDAMLELDASAILLIPTLIACIFALLRPSSIRRLVVVATLYGIYFCYSLPTYINHAIMFFMIDLTIVVTFFWQLARGRDPDRYRQEFFDAIAPVGRYLLLMMYFYGIFHKLNAGWLDPEVSCGVIAFNSLLSALGLNGPFTDFVAIYGTLILEAIAILFLCMPRWKYWGFLIGIPFHLLITLFPLAWFMGFTAMVLAFYSLFLPEEFAGRLSNFVTRVRVYRREFAVLVVTGLVAFALLLLGAHVYGPESGSSFIAGIGRNAYWTFLSGLLMAIGIVFFALVMTFAFGLKVPTSWKYWVPRPAILFVLPVIFFINGFAPYIGLKTEATIAMFSNLHTEDGQTNHIFFDTPPYLFDYQSNIVHVLEAPPEFVHWAERHAQRAYPDGQFTLVAFAFWDYLHKNPETAVTYSDGTQTHRVERAADVLHEHELSWLMRKILTFKPVDFTRPKVCSH